MSENNENDATHKSEINATMAFTQSLGESTNFSHIKWKRKYFTNTILKKF